MERARRIQRLRWEVGGVIPEDVKKNLAKTEIEFFTRYDKILGTYMRSFPVALDMDLTSVRSLKAQNIPLICHLYRLQLSSFRVFVWLLSLSPLFKV
jgi:hypothetical protein